MPIDCLTYINNIYLMSVKYYKEGEGWVRFPGTAGLPGKDAYLLAKDNGYEGSREDYEKALLEMPTFKEAIAKNTSEIETLKNNVTPDLENYATKDYVNSKTNELNSTFVSKLNDYDTTANVNSKLAELQNNISFKFGVLENGVVKGGYVYYNNVENININSATEFSNLTSSAIIHSTQPITFSDAFNLAVQELSGHKYVYCIQ